jgi:hypothetical protein
MNHALRHMHHLGNTRSFNRLARRRRSTNHSPVQRRRRRRRRITRLVLIQRRLRRTIRVVQRRRRHLRRLAFIQRRHGRVISRCLHRRHRRRHGRKRRTRIRARRDERESHREDLCRDAELVERRGQDRQTESDARVNCHGDVCFDEREGPDGRDVAGAVCGDVGGELCVEAGQVHGHEDFGFEVVAEFEADGDGGAEGEAEEDFDVGDVDGEGEGGEGGAGKAVDAGVADVGEFEADAGVVGELFGVSRGLEGFREAVLTATSRP